MRKFLITLLIAASTAASAQEFAVGTNVVSVGIGFGGAFGSYNYSAQSPGLSLQYERGIWPIDGPGVISLGGYAGIKSYKYDQRIGLYEYKQRWNYVVLGIRSAYHYTGLEVENLDVYGGVMLGYNILSYTYSDNDPQDFTTYRGNYGSSFGFSLYVGGRYYLTENIAAFMELGYGVSYLNLGVAVRL